MELAQDLLICTAAGFAMRGLGALLQNHNAETDRFLERVSNAPTAEDELPEHAKSS